MSYVENSQNNSVMTRIQRLQKTSHKSVAFFKTTEVNKHKQQTEKGAENLENYTASRSRIPVNKRADNHL
jgi:hypothetical protein